VRIIFAGSPAFAVPSLTGLLDSDHQVVAVITQPARPAGRGLTLVDPPVKVFAASRGLTVFQPEKFNTTEFLATLEGLAPDLIITAAYGRILRRRALGIPRLGCVNLHASLLPRYRGVAPVNWAIIKGETEAGVTTFFMDEGVDTGDIILARSTPIGPDETAEELLERLAEIGAGVLVETCGLIASGKAPRVKQDGSLASYAPKMAKQDGRIDWTLEARAVHAHIRGVSPWPGAFCLFRDQPLKVLRSGLFSNAAVSTACAGSSPDSSPESGLPAMAGTVVGLDSEAGILVSCGSGAIYLKTVQAQGKKPTGGADFARGYRVKAGDILG
jgi:methionyl-tRNA formyltransferase